MGQRQAALAALDDALRIDPDDLQAVRRALIWTRGKARLAAAERLATFDDDVSWSMTLTELGKAGRKALGLLSTEDSLFRARVAWRGTSAPELITVTNAGVEHRIAIPPHKNEAGGGFDHAADIAVPRPPDVQRASLVCDGDLLDAWMNREPAVPPRSLRQTMPGHNQAVRNRSLAIVIPIYGDLAASRRCLDAVRLEAKSVKGCRIVLVDDASPNPALKRLVRRFQDRQGATLIENETNLGFAASVNKALARIAPGDDILLLNADAFLPRHALPRFQELADRYPTIGTFTPFSNKGEYTSFPIPSRPNALPSAEECADLDSIAAKANRHRVVDIPSGIGFCLYITAACFEAVGFLSERFGRGYFEDVDFCLRAREKGFRNVCATSIYVGHAGSRSFKDERTALIARNHKILDARFPNDQKEAQVFFEADPLADARAAIEQDCLTKLVFDKMIVAGSGAAEACATERAYLLRKTGAKLLLVTHRREASGHRIFFREAAKQIPQSLSFFLSSDARSNRPLATLIGKIRSRRLEIVDPGATPAPLLDLLRRHDLPLDLLIADGSRLLSALNGEDAKTRNVPGIRLLKQAHRTYAPDKAALDFLRYVAPGCRAVLGPSRSQRNAGGNGALKSAAPGSPTRKAALTAFGIVVAHPNTEDATFLTLLARRWHRDRPAKTAVPLIIFGALATDWRIMTYPDVFATGALKSGDDMRRLTQLHRVSHLLLGTRRPLFGHPLMAAAAGTGLRSAAFDWSFGRRRPQAGNLALDPRSSDDALGDALFDWLSHA